MFHSNITTGSPYKIQKTRTIVQTLRASFKKAFHYSPEDKFAETKQAADQLEALYALQASEDYDASEYEPQTPKFTFWI